MWLHPLRGARGPNAFTVQEVEEHGLAQETRSSCDGQVLAKSYTLKADMWSLGVISYMLLTGSWAQMQAC